MLSAEYDALIVGVRVAGSSLAIRLAQRGRIEAPVGPPGAYTLAPRRG